MDQGYLGYCATCNADSTMEVCVCGNITVRYRTVREVYPEIDEIAKRKPLPLVPRNQLRHSALDDKSLAGGS